MLILLEANTRARRLGSSVDAGSDSFPFDTDIGQQAIIEPVEPGDVATTVQPFLQLLFQIMQHFDVPLVKCKALPCRGEVVFKQALREAFEQNAAPVSRWCLPSFDRSEIAPSKFFALQPSLQPAFQE